MIRLYREIATDRRAALVQFAPRCKSRPAQYTMRWLDTDELFHLSGDQVVREFEHIGAEVRVEVGKQ